MKLSLSLEGIARDGIECERSMGCGFTARRMSGTVSSHQLRNGGVKRGA